MTLGKDTTQEDLDYVLEYLPKAVNCFSITLKILSPQIILNLEMSVKIAPESLWDCAEEFRSNVSSRRNYYDD